MLKPFGKRACGVANPRDTHGYRCGSRLAIPFSNQLINSASSSRTGIACLVQSMKSKPLNLPKNAPILQATHDVAHDESESLRRAKAFAEPLLTGQFFGTGEGALNHAEGVAEILREIGAAPSVIGASYLVYASEYLAKPEDVIEKAFGSSYASLATHTRKLVQIQQAARQAQVGQSSQALQTERVRKMLLAFSHDLRVVLLRLASRLQTMRFYAQTKQTCPEVLAREALQVYAPLANRLGIGQIKWELEDYAFRFLHSQEYKRIAKLLDEKRIERELSVTQLRDQLALQIQNRQVQAQIQGRPKHIYSIWKKMQGKSLSFDRIFDVRALRVIVQTVPECYAVLSLVHELYPQVPDEFDDYIARPKANGYQSLHTVVLDERKQTIEIQIRTQQMHEHAELGVAAHWAYKEAGSKGLEGVSASGQFDMQVAEARKAVLRQLLAWERDFVANESGDAVTPQAARADAYQPLSESKRLFDDRIYVFTPQATIIELTTGATPVDFAYAVHTNLGHRCRGVKVDGAMVPLNTPLTNGQTVEIIAIKEGGPSMDWLNAELGYLKSARAKAKVRAWFNTLAQGQTIAKGREAVEKLLQREGKTATKLDDLAARLGFKHADDLFAVVGKDEFSLRNIENLLRPPEPVLPDSLDGLQLKSARSHTQSDSGGAKGGVLVVGIDSLLTSLSRCCKPAPPDPINGYVTRGKGVAIHRANCRNFMQMAKQQPERVIQVQWNTPAQQGQGHYSVGVSVQAIDRTGLLRDISDVFAKEKMNITEMRIQSSPKTRSRDELTHFSFTIETTQTSRLSAVLHTVCQISGVRNAKRS
jgi:GTP pyrophosphokinase